MELMGIVKVASDGDEHDSGGVLGGLVWAKDVRDACWQE